MNKYFREQFWIKESRSDVGLPIVLNERRQDEPFNFIYPMFNQYDPRYITQKKIKGFDAKNSEHLKLYNDDEITNLAFENICTPFEHILDLVKKS